MNIQDTEIVELVSQIEEAEQKLLSHPMHKVLAIQSTLRLLHILNMSFEKFLINHTKNLRTLSVIYCLVFLLCCSLKMISK